MQKTTQNKLVRALAVIVTDLNIQKWLKQNDPKAFGQARDALRDALAEMDDTEKQELRCIEESFNK